MGDRMARPVKGREGVRLGQMAWVGCILALPLNSSVVFGNLQNLSVPPFCLQSGAENLVHLYWVVEIIKE